MKTAQEHEIDLVSVRHLERDAAFDDRWSEINSRITRRAYEIYENRFKTHGHDKEDWLQAESETLRRVPIVVHETEYLYTVDGEVSGFNPDELKVSVEPFRVFITGHKRGAVEDADQGSKEIFISVELSNLIDVHTVIAELSSSTLTVSMRKTPLCPSVATRPETSKSSGSRSGQLRKRADLARGRVPSVQVTNSCRNLSRKSLWFIKSLCAKK